MILKDQTSDVSIKFKYNKIKFLKNVEFSSMLKHSENIQFLKKNSSYCLIRKYYFYFMNIENALREETIM